MKHRNNHLLVGYWQRLRKGRDAPDQTDIDPRAIKRILSHVFILEASNPDRPVYRLAGTSHCDQYGHELKGTNFLDRWEAQSRGALTLLLRQSLRIKQPVCLASIGGGTSSGMLEVESVLAPVTFISEAPTRFIGMSQVLSDPAALLGRPITFERLIASMLVSEDEAATFADLPPPSARGSLSRTPHLRLVVDQDLPPTPHFEMNKTMQQLIAALEAASLA